MNGPECHQTDSLIADPASMPGLRSGRTVNGPQGCPPIPKELTSNNKSVALGWENGRPFGPRLRSPTTGSAAHAGALLTSAPPRATVKTERRVQRNAMRRVRVALRLVNRHREVNNSTI